MRFYMQRATGSGGSLFTVCDDKGNDAFRVTGIRTLLSAKLSLVTAEDIEAARITGVGTASLSKFTIEIPGERRMTLLQNLTPAGGSVTVRNPNWSFRGDISMGNFDVIDVDRSLIMTHGVKWGANGCCWCVQVEDERNTVRCLCLCAIVDGLLTGSAETPIPVKGG